MAFLLRLRPAAQRLAPAQAACFSTQRLVTLSDIKDNKGARKKPIRVGRGIGSGRGKTCGKGTKGQKARSGTALKPWFEGGQTPLYKRIPKRGFVNTHAKKNTGVSLAKMQEWIEKGRIDPRKPITLKTILDSELLNTFKYGVTIFGSGGRNEKPFNWPINLEVSQITDSARMAIEAAGGTVRVVYYNRVGLQALLHPEKFDILPSTKCIPPPKFYHRYPEQVKEMGAEPQPWLSPEDFLKKKLEARDAAAAGN